MTAQDARKLAMQERQKSKEKELKKITERIERKAAAGATMMVVKLGKADHLQNDLNQLGFELHYLDDGYYMIAW